MDQLTIFVATFGLVFLRGMQQQNVIHENYIAAGLTPYLIACAEVASVLLVVENGWTSIPWVGTGGTVGILTSMLIHKKYFRKPGKSK